MNFLAHTYLSGNKSDIIIGNLIGDTVKGKKYETFRKDIQIGLLLHRAIDVYTDNHPIIKESNALIKPWFGRYSGIVSDIYYDHFLAKNWSDFKSEDLAKYVNRIYVELIKNMSILPAIAQRVCAYMILRDWLGTYGSFYHLHQVFLGMDIRTQNKGHMGEAVSVLKQNYHTLEHHFFSFMPDVSEFANMALKKLLTES